MSATLGEAETAIARVAKSRRMVDKRRGFIFDIVVGTSSKN